MKFLSGIVATLSLSKAVVGIEVTNTETEPGDAIVEWLRSKGGFLSNKVEFAALDKNDEKSPNGMFATSPIQKGEEILRIPASTLIKPPPGGSMCDTARILLDEYELEEESEYEPFVTYMFESFAYERNPNLWSKKGKALFNTMIGDDLPPHGFGENTFDESCLLSGEDEYDLHGEWLEEAWSIVVSRGWTEVLVPVYDMINHRNGHWHNVDQATSAHDEGEDISVIAIRDIDVGEQIHNSYNECHDIDCNGIAHTYTTPEMTMDYGFVEDYPRRFCFEIVPDDELVFDLDIVREDEEDEGFILTWLSKSPDSDELDWLKENLERLQLVDDVVSNRAQFLPIHEKNLIEEYYDALEIALEMAIESVDDEENEEEEEYDAKSTPLGEHEYDSLEAKRDTLDYDLGNCGDYSFNGPGSIKEMINSHYQEIVFGYELKNGRDETCLELSSFLQTCTSFRAHYHEFLVHYPASFVDNVKRVLFIGGGDNMIVHEIMKYPNLELVVGMELDQQVVRSSFKHMATQPHFDKDVMQWWFGDASKSLHMLPSQYFGTFDLVLIDLQTFVVNSLMVTSEHSMMDYAMLLLKPEGVLMQNEDFVERIETGFATHTVDIELLDIPTVCRQSINMGSNGVNFLRKKQKDHGIESLVYESIAKENDHDYQSWWNYRHTTKKINESMTSGDVDDSNTTIKQTNTNGFVIFLEVEGVGMPLDSPENLEIVLSQAVKKAGLTKVSFSPLISGEGKPSETFIMMLKEGYISVEVWPQNSYCAFDIMFLSDFDKQEHIEKEIIGAVDGQSSSSYRVVTGGVHGVNDQSVPTREGSVDNSDVTAGNDTSPTATFEQSQMDVVLQEFSSLDSMDSVTTVLCFDEQKPCKSLDSLRNNVDENNKVVPVWSCNALPEKSDDTYQSMGKCKNDLAQNLQRTVESTGKINRLVIDPEVPLTVGQILHKIMVDTQIRKKVLADQFIILAPTLDVDESWRKHLLDRFRTEFVQFSPAHLAEVYVSDTTSTTEQMKIEVFSSLHKEFYSNLEQVVRNSEKKTGLTLDVKDVKDGILKWKTDKQEVIVTDEDYDNSSAYDQWKSQHPLGLQTIFQFDLQAQLLPLHPGQKVLANFDVDIWAGEFYEATIISNNDDGTYDIIYDVDKEIEHSVERNLLRQWETEEEDAKLKVKERVLYPNVNNMWRQGVIVKESEGDEYELQCLYSGDYKIQTRDNLMRQVESITKMEKTEISVSVMKELLESTPVLKESVTVHKDNIDGFVMTGAWKQGRVIIVWDGGDHIDLNMFTYDDGKDIGNLFRDVFLSKMKGLAVSARDEQPRGFGQVVNLRREMESVPRWVSIFS